LGRKTESDDRAAKHSTDSLSHRSETEYCDNRLEDRSRPQRHTDDPVVLIIVLNGAFMFGADLARALHARKEFLSCATRLNDGLLSDKCDAS
jgi:hypoxanthine-guanine phosphoribosyltransferase